MTNQRNITEIPQRRTWTRAQGSAHTCVYYIHLRVYIYMCVNIHAHTACLRVRRYLPGSVLAACMYVSRPAAVPLLGIYPARIRITTR